MSVSIGDQVNRWLCLVESNTNYRTIFQLCISYSYLIHVRLVNVEPPFRPAVFPRELLACQACKPHAVHYGRLTSQQRPLALSTGEGCISQHQCPGQQLALNISSAKIRRQYCHTALTSLRPVLPLPNVRGAPAVSTTWKWNLWQRAESTNLWPGLDEGGNSQQTTTTIERQSTASRCRPALVWTSLGLVWAGK